MKLVVDLTRCQGYAQCAFLDPSAFTIHGDEALLYDPEPGDEQRERVLRAAAACPVQALVLDRVGGRNGAPQADAAGRGEARRSGADGGFLRSGRIVIVGASLAGLRAAEALRHEGFWLADPDRGRTPRALRPAAAVQAGSRGVGSGGGHRVAATR